MYQNVKTRMKRLIDPSNKAAVAKVFRNPEYIQDLEARRPQLLFFKLLMAIAYVDDEVDNNEINLIKNFTFEHCLNEQEWKEIEFYRHSKLTKEELNLMIQQVCSEITSRIHKEEFLTAIKEIVDADDNLHDLENEILDSFQKKISDQSIIGNWVSKFTQKIKAGQPDSRLEFEQDAQAYVFNPVAVYLKRSLGGNLQEWEVPGAKLGVLLYLCHADGELHDNEKSHVLDLIQKWCDIDSDKASTVYGKLDKIPKDHFEIAHLSRLLTEEFDLKERQSFLLDLYEIAYVDDEFHKDEDHAIRLSSQFLMLSHQQFIEVKLEAKKRFKRD